MAQTLEQFRSRGTKTLERTVVSFVIPALNEEQWICKCIDSIGRMTLPTNVGKIEIIVVDNESTDRTVEFCRRRGTIVVSCQPGNPSRARNLGAKTAVGEWLAFVDADCCLDASWLVDCAKVIATNDVIAAGSQILPPPESDSWVANSIGQLSGGGHSELPERVRWLPTAGLLVKTEHFSAIGGFDEKLITCEDCDLGYRLSERGRLMYVPSAKLIHFGESKTLQEVLWREAWRTRGNIRLALSRPGDWKNWISMLLPIVFVLLISVGIAGVVMACLGAGSMLLGLGMIVLGASLPVALAVRKVSGVNRISNLSRLSIVMTTFLAGRALGLVWRFPRVER